MLPSYRYLKTTISCFLAIFIYCSSDLKAISVADDAYKLELLDINGELHRLSEYHGKVVLLNFWTSWCTPCIREFSTMRLLGQSIESGRFTTIAVNVREGKGIVERFHHLQEDGISLLLDMDGKAAERWGVGAYPTSFIIDPHGKIQRKIIGETDWGSEEMHAYIKTLLPAEQGI
jgi:thiol-disulfide isomerase/thioredoxin